MQRQTLAWLVAAALVLGLAAPGWSATDGGQWTRKAPLPQAMSEIGVTSIGGKIYVVGGQTQIGTKIDTHSPLLDEYDPATNRWTARAPMPLGLSHPGVAEMAGKIYVFGGFLATVHVGAQDAAFVYDTRTNRWSALPRMPQPLGSVVAAAVGGKIYLFGGRGPDKKTVAAHYVFDPKTRRWSQAAPLPLARDHAGIAVIAGRIHVFGGRTGETSDNVTEHDVYDPRTDRWSSAAPLPVARSSGAYTVLDGRILFAGGECRPKGGPRGGQTFDDMTAYDPKTNRWVTLPPLPSPRHAFGAGTVGHVAYFAAGAPTCGGGYSADLLAFTFR